MDTNFSFKVSVKALKNVNLHTVLYGMLYGKVQGDTRPTYAASTPKKGNLVHKSLVTKNSSFEFYYLSGFNAYNQKQLIMVVHGRM